MQTEAKALLNEGRDLDFFKELENYDSMMVNDQLLKNKDEIDVHITRENGKLTKWTLTEKLTQLSTKKKREGTSLKALYDLFHGKEVQLESSIAILALKHTSFKKRSDKKIESTWFLIDVDCPYEETEDGVPYLQTIDLVLPKNEYRLMMETRLAIYETAKGILYPFLSISASSIGKSLDAATLFKKSETGTARTIGAAMFLADRISKRSVNLLIREDSDIFKPILSVAGKNYIPQYPVEFYRCVYEYLSQQGLYYLNHWTCDSDQVTAEFKLSELSGSETESVIEVSLGLIPGVITAVKFYKEVDHAKVLLRTNKLPRQTNGSLNLCCNDSMDKLFYEIGNVFTDFDKAWSSPALEEMCDSEVWLTTCPVLLGKKNLAKVKNSISGKMTKRIFYKKLLAETKDFPLAAYYKNIKENFYWDLLSELTKEDN